MGPPASAHCKRIEKASDLPGVDAHTGESGRTRLSVLMFGIGSGAGRAAFHTTAETGSEPMKERQVMNNTHNRTKRVLAMAMGAAAATALVGISVAAAPEAFAHHGEPKPCGCVIGKHFPETAPGVPDDVPQPDQPGRRPPANLPPGLHPPGGKPNPGGPR